jgi:hypothetical protein
MSSAGVTATCVARQNARVAPPRPVHRAVARWKERFVSLFIS